MLRIYTTAENRDVVEHSTRKVLGEEFLSERSI
jgi:hypothetical protein